MAFMHFCSLGVGENWTCYPQTIPSLKLIVPIHVNHLNDKCLWIYCHTDVRIEDTVINQIDKSPALRELLFQWGEISKQKHIEVAERK